MIRRTLTAAILFAAITMPCPAGAETARDTDIAALEARVAELEALVMQLVDKSALPAAAAPPAAAATHTYRFGGYIKLDGIFSDYSGGELAPSSIGTQFYVPATIPVGGTPGDGPDFNMQARETRINFDSDHVLASGDRFGTFIEMDFFLGTGGNQRVTNSYNPRLRHAFLTYNNWLAGQTWSTFQDVDALPENLDFIGPSEGTTFERQAQLRYRRGPWEFAIENPETTVTPLGGGPVIESDDGRIPDLVARHTTRFENGYIRAAVLGRQLHYKSGSTDDSETAFGLSVSGKHRFGEDDIRWMATVGSGTGRYLGLNTSNGAVLDANGDLNAIDQWGGFVSYRHFWDSRWRSNFTLSYLGNDNDVALTGTGVTRDVYSVHANLLFEPAEKMTVGGEIMFAERSLESDLSGDLKRLLFSAKYAF
jgi:hypothetical protein